MLVNKFYLNINIFLLFFIFYSDKIFSYINPDDDISTNIKKFDKYEINNIIKDNFNIKKIYTEDIYQSYKYIEDLLASNILYDNLNLKHDNIFLLNKMKLKYSLLFEYLKEKHKFNDKEYKEVYTFLELEKNENYSISYFKIKEKKTAINILDLLSKHKKYNEIFIVYNDFSKIYNLNKHDVFLKYIKTNNLKFIIRQYLSNNLNLNFINKPIKIGLYYYIILIHKNNKFTFDDFNV